MRMLSAVLVLAAMAMSAASARAEEAPMPAETEAPKEAGRPSEKGTLGVGLIFGEPTGISAKLYLKDDQAIQGAFGASFYVDAWQLHGEYVWHPFILQDRDTFVLPVYFGPGLRFMYYNGGRSGETADGAIGLRAVAGLLFDFKNVPLDVFLELGGAVEYRFETGWNAGLNFGAGIRYYF